MSQGPPSAQCSSASAPTAPPTLTLSQTTTLEVVNYLTGLYNFAIHSAEHSEDEVMLVKYLNSAFARGRGTNDTRLHEWIDKQPASMAAACIEAEEKRCYRLGTLELLALETLEVLLDEVNWDDMEIPTELRRALVRADVIVNASIDWT